jgi:hypothetical protein
MTVVCEGDRWVMEQLGEKQDFEAVLSRLGFHHEDFVLQVRRARAPGTTAAWSSNYSIQVTSVLMRKSNIYWGGPNENWVAQFEAELADGFFGGPTIFRFPRRAALRDANC